MSRTRMIKPSFFKHFELYAAEIATGLPLRVAFAGLWTVTDRAGRFRWKGDIKTDVIPYDVVDVLVVLDALEKHGFVTSYVVAGKRYGFIPSFNEHQTFHHTERQSTLPPPLNNGESPVMPPADTVTVTVAGTGTQLVVDDQKAAGEEFEPGTVPAFTALDVVIWSNRAVEEKWGPQPTRRVYHLGNAAAAFEDLTEIGIEGTVLRLSIYRQCRESTRDLPPNGPAYFVPGAKLDWAATLAQRAQLASGETPPPKDASNGAPSPSPRSRRGKPSPQKFEYSKASDPEREIKWAP